MDTPETQPTPLVPQLPGAEPPDSSPRDPQLRDAGPWGSDQGRLLRHALTGERFLALPLGGPHPLPTTTRPTDSGELSGAQRWEDVVDRLAEVPSGVLVPPRAVVSGAADSSAVLGATGEDRPVLLYEDPERLGRPWSFADHLASGSGREQRTVVEMAADLARAMAQLHRAGVVLRRLSLRDVLQAPEGWVLLLGPGADPLVPPGQDLPRLGAADVAVLCAAAAAALTGHQPRPGRSAPLLRETHPGLPPGAAAVLDRILSGQGLGQDLESGAEVPGGAGEDPGEVAARVAAQLQAALDADGDAAGAGCGGGAVVDAVPGAGDESGVDRDAAGEPQGTGPRIVQRRAAARSSAARSSAAQSFAAASRTPARLPRSRPAARRPRVASSAPPRASRRVLAGALGLVLCAGVVAGWSALGGLRQELEAQAPPAVAATGSVPAGSASESAASVVASASASEPAVEPAPDAAPPAASAETAAAAVAAETDAGSPAAAAPGDPTRSVGGPAGATDDPAAAVGDPAAAAEQLVEARGEALRARDLRALEAIYVPGAADLDDDRATVAALSAGDFLDLTMGLTEAEVIREPEAAHHPETGSPASGGASGTARIRATAFARASGLVPEQEGASTTRQPVEIELQRTAGRWAIVDVIPQ